MKNRETRKARYRAITLKNCFEVISQSMGNQNKTLSRLRLEIAQVAARYVAVDGINDFLTAKKKAARYLGADPDRNLPTNHEVEQALIDYQNLFQAVNQKQLLLSKRRKSLKAMKFLIKFDPRLVGPVLTGTATEFTEINIHLFYDEPEQVGFYLDEHGIPYSCCEKSVRISLNERINLPAYRFVAENDVIILIIFPERQKNLNPISSVTNKPMRRASMQQVESLIKDPG